MSLMIINLTMSILEHSWGLLNVLTFSTLVLGIGEFEPDEGCWPSCASEKTSLSSE